MTRHARHGAGDICVGASPVHSPEQRSARTRSPITPSMIGIRRAATTLPGLVSVIVAGE
jgi:hypothetical protein